MSETTTPPAWAVTPERLAEIKKICACVPFIDNGVGVQETQQAFHDLINALTIPAGHVRLPSGEDVRVPMTADGKLVVEPHEVWWWDGNVLLGGAAHMDTVLVFIDPNDQSMAFSPNGGVAECYSTREAARAAAESARAGGGA